MKLLIVRHGEPDYEADSLTEKGWREAELLSQYLVRQELTDIYLSPMGRAQATAKPTLDKLHRTGETLVWLEEFRGLIRDPEGEDLRIPWNLPPRVFAAHPELMGPGWLDSPLYQGSDMAEKWNAATEGLDALLARYGYLRDAAPTYRVQGGGSRATVVLFCHFAKGMVLLSHLTGIPLPVAWQGFSLAPTSVTTIVTEEREAGTAVFRCVSAGDLSHLNLAGEPMSHAGLFRELGSDPEHE